MTSDRVVPHPPPSSSDLLRAVIAIIDPRVPLPMIAAMIAALLPDIRVDVLFSRSSAAAMQLFLTAGDDHAMPAPDAALANGAAFVRWLADLGYGTVERFPMIDTMQLVGWFVLSCVEDELDASQRSLVTELANAFVLRYIAVKRESKLQHARESLREAETRLEQAGQVRQQSARAASTIHDLCTLLSVIIGHARILHHTAPPELRENLQAIIRAADDSSLIVRRMLAHDYAPELVTAPLTFVPSVVHEAIALTQPLWSSCEDIVVTTELKPVPAVLADPAEIREVLVSLIVNAIAAMPSGGTMRLSSKTAHGEVIIAMTDTGEGIAREYHAAIFEPRQTTRASQSGPGLAASRAIVERVGGRLTIESAPGQGATFTIALPAAPSLERDDRLF